jgi:membrane-associated phospholipid phosphatase
LSPFYDEKFIYGLFAKLYNRHMALPQKPSTFILLWLLAGAVVIELAWSLDYPVDKALDVANSPSLHQFAQWSSWAGQGGVLALGGIFFAVLFILLHRPTVAAKIVFVMLTGEFTGGVALILRVFAGRTRPHAETPQGFYGLWHAGHWIMGRYEFSAFPSGHSATAVGLAAAVWMVHRGWGALAALFALAVMWSRIALQAHHFSDVVASVVLAIPLAMLSKKVLLQPLEFHFGSLEQSRQKR